MLSLIHDIILYINVQVFMLYTQFMNDAVGSDISNLNSQQKAGRLTACKDEGLSTVEAHA